MDAKAFAFVLFELVGDLLRASIGKPFQPCLTTGLRMLLGGATQPPVSLGGRQMSRANLRFGGPEGCIGRRRSRTRISSEADQGEPALRGALLETGNRLEEFASRSLKNGA